MRKLIYLLLVIGMLALGSSAIAECFVVIKSGNIRIGPGTKYKVVAQAKLGDYRINVKNVSDWVSFRDHNKIINKNKIKVGWVRLPYDKAKVGSIVWLTIDSTEDLRNPKFVIGKIKSYTGNAKHLLHQILYYPEENRNLYIHKSLVRLNKSDLECRKYAYNVKGQKTPVDLFATDTSIRSVVLSGVASNGYCEVPSINLWNVPGGIAARAQVIARVSGCIGIRAEVLDIRYMTYRTWYHVRTSGMKRGWVSETLIRF
jgi:hypothetical protein